MIIQAQVTDLWRDDCGWSANCSWVKNVQLEVDPSTSDLAIVRRIKAALGIQGFRRDDWAGADWSWRNGAIGAWADVID